MFDFLKRKKQNHSQSTDNDTYKSLREMAFSIKPEQLGVSLENDEQVFGAVVDMSVSNGMVATMICFIDGAASLYFSNGGGIIGAGQHESVQKAAGSFLISVHQVLPIMKKIDNFDMVPKENHHIFYLFTKAEVYFLDLDVEDYQESKEKYFLFSLSQMLLTEIIKTSEKIK